MLAFALACKDQAIVDPAMNGVPASIEANVSTPLLTVGQTAQVTAVVKDAAGIVLPGVSLTMTSDNSAVAEVGAGGVVTGIAAGTAKFIVRSGVLSGTASLAVRERPAPNPVAPAWTFCVNAGQSCDFPGLRDVRLGADIGPYVQRAVYHTVPCAPFGFDDQDPAPNQPLHCDYGPLRSTTLTNPTPGMLGAAVIVPLGSRGESVARSRSTADVPVVNDGSGSFRTTCTLATFAFDDPIVFPGQVDASHLHMFFGNTAVNAGSTAQSIASSGNSTCRGGTLNRTAYWVPAVIDGSTGEVQVPDDGIFYYKTGYNIDPKAVRTLPPGLRMIAGNKDATSKQEYIEWYCRDVNAPVAGSIPTVCRVGDAVRLAIQFPQCWDGKNLDSPDHKRHMAYPIYRNAPEVSTCPPTHPVTLPAITEHFDFPVTDTSNPARWRLTSDMYSSSLRGGLSAHADWMGGWDEITFKTIVTQCLNRGLDCGVGSLGNGTTLY